MSETFYICREDGKDGAKVYPTQEAALEAATRWAEDTKVATTVFECVALCRVEYREADGCAVTEIFDA